MKKNLLVIFAFLSSIVSAQQTSDIKFDFYGFIRSDLFFNSRQNIETIDGIFPIFPKPIITDVNGKDIHAAPQAEMLSVATRMGIDIQAPAIFNAQSSGKIEMDFCGTGSTYFLLRLRQAYMKLNWHTSELLVGQTWHPLYGDVTPTIVAFNSGSPFQPFNRSPQIRFTYHFTPSLSAKAAVIYQMQYTSFGPEGRSNVYMKKALLPNFYAGIENKTKHWLTGIAVDMKVIKPDTRLFSKSAVLYARYAENSLQIKAKTLLGQNLSDLQIPFGYGLNSYNSEKKEIMYTNFNVSSSWLNIVYGKKWQFGLFSGYLKNLGSEKTLFSPSKDSFLIYDSGYFTGNQHIDELFRISPHFSFNYKNLRLGLEYSLDKATYGNLQNNGKISNPYPVINHRAAATAVYSF